MSTPVDFTRKFVFEQADVRGEFARLHESFRQILEIHQYAPAVGKLIGEFLAASVLLSTTIKFEGRLILQAESSGEIPLIMAECSSDLQVRAIARGAEQATSQEFGSLLRNGRLAITIESDAGQRYQGIVPLGGAGLASCIEHYFENSEQLPTRLWLASDTQRASGLLLQQLPAHLVSDAEARARHWEQLHTLADTVTTGELLELEHERLLTRLFLEDPLKLFPAASAAFACSCSRQRCHDALTAISARELEEILTAQGHISMDCEFCNQRYLFARDDLREPLDTDAAHAVH
ncbi:MAG: Hsp33 family molecular chaperone HslO [Gammaproteobacteria bacterium]|nr:Hsp33 family molecular chaperone HslO [Gammaproteobacteria bacterium]